MIALLLACRPEPTPPADVPVDTAATGSTASTGATGDSATTGASVPGLAEALAGRCDPTPAGTGVAAGDDLRKVTLADAVPRCNDGTPPVMYVRAATDPAHAHDWVLQLGSGGYCDSYEACAARWCAEDNYSAANMSTAWTPAAGGGRGLTTADASNALSGWNVAELYYCTSDLWIGRAPDVVFAGDPAYRLPFSGHDVLGALLDALDAGATSDDGAASVSLVDPATIVFSGSSAGAYGAVIELGRIVDRYPDARVVGAIDSIFSPSREVMAPDVAAAWDQALQARYDDVVVAVYDGWVDASCLAAGDEPWRCADVDHVVREHRTADLMYHLDLYDPVLYDFVSVSGLVDVAYAQAGADTLRLYGALGMGVHGSVCHEHTALDDAQLYEQMAVTDALAGGPGRTPEDVVVSVLARAPQTAVDDPSGVGSACP